MNDEVMKADTHEPDYRKAMLFHSDRADQYAAERDAALSALAAMTKERDEALHFLDVAVDKSPKPLKALGKYLADLLDEDDWPTAERLLNGAVTTLAASEARVAKLVEALDAFPADWRERAHSFKGVLKLQAAWADGFNAARAAITEATQ